MGFDKNQAKAKMASQGLLPVRWDHNTIVFDGKAALEMEKFRINVNNKFGNVELKDGDRLPLETTEIPYSHYCRNVGLEGTVEEEILDPEEFKQRKLNLYNYRLHRLNEMRNDWPTRYPFIKSRLIAHHIKEMENYEIKNYTRLIEESEICKLYESNLKFVSESNFRNQMILDLHKAAKGEDICQYARYIKMSDHDINTLLRIRDWMLNELYILDKTPAYKIKPLEECPFITKNKDDRVI